MPRRVERVPIVIVGGGVAGLSAAWWMERAGMRDYVLLELAETVGGNSRAGENAVTAYPWGAHYLPLPGPDATYVRMLLEEMGILVDGAWRERDLVHAPRERTFAHGRWHEGLAEAVATGPADHAELERFAGQVDALRATGQFTIPLASGVLRADAALDGLTADAWLAAHGYRGRAVRWLMDYACRDDFGMRARDASAWAALHYFAARDAEDGPLTWPEGNARLARHMAARAAPRTVAGAPVSRVSRAPDGRGLRVRAGEVEWHADVVIFAAPLFIAARVVEDAPRVDVSYSPWLVTNLVLDRWPASSRADAGLEPGVAWDNVLAGSPALGYVVATHQSLRAVQERTVWTHYWALADGDPRAERRRLAEGDWRTWADRVLDDLERPHPDIRDCVSRVDLLRYGHAMPRPVPGFLAARRALWDPAPASRVLYAHSDVSGLPLFEEAQFRGVTAAQRALALVGGAPARRT